MVSLNIPGWLYEAGIYGVAAVIFCTVMLPICYYIGVRDGKRAYQNVWILVGYRKCFDELSPYRSYFAKPTEARRITELTREEYVRWRESPDGVKAMGLPAPWRTKLAA